MNQLLINHKKALVLNNLRYILAIAALIITLLLIAEVFNKRSLVSETSLQVQVPDSLNPMKIGRLWLAGVILGLMLITRKVREIQLKLFYKAPGVTLAPISDRGLKFIATHLTGSKYNSLLCLLLLFFCELLYFISLAYKYNRLGYRCYLTMNEEGRLTLVVVMRDLEPEVPEGGVNPAEPEVPRVRVNPTEPEGEPECAPGEEPVMTAEDEPECAPEEEEPVMTAEDVGANSGGPERRADEREIPAV